MNRVTVSTPARHSAALAFAEVAEVYRGDGFARMADAAAAALGDPAVSVADFDGATYDLYRALCLLRPDGERPRMPMDEISNLF